MKLKEEEHDTNLYYCDDDPPQRLFFGQPLNTRNQTILRRISIILNE